MDTNEERLAKLAHASVSLLNDLRKMRKYTKDEALIVVLDDTIVDVRKVSSKLARLREATM